jgi:hypothetical protein
VPPRFRMRTDGAEPSANFTVDNGVGTRTYVLYDDEEGEAGKAIPPALIEDQVLAILGTTNQGPAPRPFGSAGGRGSLSREMPMADPMYFNCFADSVAVRVERGEGHEPVTADGAGLAVPPWQPGYAGYQAYAFDVNFASRPYPVVPNGRMDFRSVDFFGRNGERKRLYHYPEWLRFCHRFLKVFDSRVSASVASAMQFWAPGVANVHNVTFTGIPDMKWRWRWYGVPERYVSSPNSYLVKLRSHVNQTEFFRKPRGSLLYVGCDTLRTYMPTQFAPAEGVEGFDDEDTVALDGSFASEILLDLELTFVLTARGDLEVQRVPGVPYDATNPLGVPPEVIPNKNWVPAGHNLAPHFNTKRFYYVHSTASKADGTPDYDKWHPQYPSWAFEAIFQDPDVPELLVDL